MTSCKLGVAGFGLQAGAGAAPARLAWIRVVWADLSCSIFSFLGKGYNGRLDIRCPTKRISEKYFWAKTQGKQGRGGKSETLKALNAEMQAHGRRQK
jgi:hypothetical protein